MISVLSFSCLISFKDSMICSSNNGGSWPVYSLVSYKLNHKGEGGCDFITVYKVKRKRKLGAGDEIRTRDFQLGKLTLYQLSYARYIRYKLIFQITGCFIYYFKFSASIHGMFFFGTRNIVATFVK